MDFTVNYIASKRKVPIFFIEIKNYIALDKVSSQAEADDLMRKDSLNSPLVQSKTQAGWVTHHGHTFLYLQQRIANSCLCASSLMPNYLWMWHSRCCGITTTWIRLEK